MLETMMMERTRRQMALIVLIVLAWGLWMLFGPQGTSERDGWTVYRVTWHEPGAGHAADRALGDYSCRTIMTPKGEQMQCARITDASPAVCLPIREGGDKIVYVRCGQPTDNTLAS